MKARFSWMLLLFFAVASTISFSQKVPGTLTEDMRVLVETPAVPGYEQQVAAKIAEELRAFSPKTDEMYNVVVTIGSGSPRRLLVAPIDEPGYIVSSIRPDGYLQVQRLPQNIAVPMFNELYSAQVVKIGTTQGKWINGAVAGISIHLLPGRLHAPSPSDIDEMYIDVGASTAAEARAGGIDLLSPLAVDRTFFEMMNNRWAAPATGDRFGAAALIELLRGLDATKLHGTLTVAFVTQNWLGTRGLQRMVQTQKPEELIYVGRLLRPTPAPGEATPAASFLTAPGAGAVLASGTPQDEPSGFAAELKQLAEQNKISLVRDFSAPLVPRTSPALSSVPVRFVHLAIPTAFASTPAEFVDGHDIAAIVSLLSAYLQGAPRTVELRAASAVPNPELPKKPTVAPTPEAILKQLTEAYGVSGGHEAAVKDTIDRLLPSWAKTQTDDSGNLILRWQSNAKTPRILVVAHQDEIGWEVHSILPDGRLDLEQRGGSVLAYFLGHDALVHSANSVHPGVMELPDGWQKPDFQWPRGARIHARMNVGATTGEQVMQMGIKAGDYITIPKKYNKLLGQRASARAFDDRIGCAALVSAAWALGPELKDRNITFVWSTSEELGLVGAAALAQRMAGEGHAPDYVFAIDTFVSSDSPLESKRFADGLLGQGFVVRAVDNSNIVPRNLVDKVLALARAQHVPVQYGATGGGNDGSAFTVYGSTDVALGWPLRYAHSPDEVIDVRDLDALAKVIAAIARGW